MIFLPVISFKADRLIIEIVTAIGLFLYQENGFQLIGSGGFFCVGTPGIDTMPVGFPDAAIVDWDMDMDWKIGVHDAIVLAMAARSVSISSKIFCWSLVSPSIYNSFDLSGFAWTVSVLTSTLRVVPGCIPGMDTRRLPSEPAAPDTTAMSACGMSTLIAAR
jgi:hypothetical protein